MPVLAAANLRLAYADHIVLDGVSISVEAGERIGIVGRNGTGKSTLIRMLAGRLSPDGGGVTTQRGCHVGYLSQTPDLDPEETLRGAAESAFARLHDLHRELDEVFEAMETADEEGLEGLLKRQERLEREIEASGGYAIDHKIDQVLHGLGFTDAQFKIKVSGLSGGQKARVALARLLLEEPDALLLDEPTNHLDLEGRLWLEQFLSEEYAGAIVMVAHDRYLLDAVVSRIVEIEDSRLIDYPGNYQDFRRMREDRRKTQQRAFEKQQTEFKREEAFIRKYKAGQRAKQARGRESRLERAKLQRIERPLELGTFDFELPRAARAGDIVVHARGLSKRYENEGAETVLFDGLDVKIERGERWAIIGPNGAGKTTLARCLLGDLEPDEGSTRLGTNVSIGYYRQSEEGMNLELPVYRFLQNQILKENPGRPLSEQEARDLAGAFLFSGNDQEKELELLSGGERSRARLAALLASAKNLLVLDEPTNHLDIPSAERLEEALSRELTPDLTLIMISHDRALIDATCEHLLILDGRGHVSVFHGTYNEWHEREQRRERERGSSTAERAKPEPAPSKAAERAPAAPARSKYSWMKLEQVEARIGELEAEIRGLDDRLADPEVWRDASKANELTDRRDALRDELIQLEAEWLRKAE